MILLLCLIFMLVDCYPVFVYRATLVLDQKVSAGRHRSCKGQLLPSVPQHIDTGSNDEKTSMQTIVVWWNRVIGKLFV